MLLVCLSPNYLRSPYCRWEWEVFHRLQARKNAAVRQFDRVIAESRMDPVCQPLDALFEAGVSGGDSDFGFGHQRSV